MAMTPFKRMRSAATESRRTPRRVFHRPVGLLHAGKYDVVQAYQLSEGGMLLQESALPGAIPLKVKSIIVISLILPGGDCIVTRGEVIYERPGKQFGVKFPNLGLHLRRQIRNYVTAKTQAEAEAEAMEGESAGAAANPPKT